MKYCMELISLVCFCVFMGCVSMPGTINTEYLSEIKSDESEKIQKLEKNILAKKSERDTAARNYSVSAAEESLTRETAAFLEQKSAVYRAKEKLYSLQNDDGALQGNKLAIETLGRTRGNHNSYIQYAMANNSSLKAALEISEAEMSVAVWEMNYEKSRVAREYQNKRPEEFGQKKSGIARYFQSKSRVDPGEYEKYLVKQRDTVKDKREAHDKLLKELKSLERFKGLKYVVE